ncbi:MAG: hypothetical protein L3J75_17200 [Methylococcaceae bacterium]|nr:hypothetical protein [Methylococcaceae bacterium]
MTKIRPDLEHVIKLYGSSLPDYSYILKKANSHNGWVRFSPRLYELMTKYKCNNYPELYQDEARIQTVLFRAFLDSDEQIVELWNEFGVLSQEEQSQYLNEFAEGSNELGKLIDDNLMHLDDMDWSPAGQVKAQKEWDKFSEKEQRQILRFSQYSLSFSLASFHNYLAVMVHGKKLTQLVAEAMAGNQTSFCYAVHIDKSILDHIPFFKQRHQQAIQQGDEDFLGLVNYRIQSPQLKGRVRHPYTLYAFCIT